MSARAPSVAARFASLTVNSSHFGRLHYTVEAAQDGEVLLSLELEQEVLLAESGEPVWLDVKERTADGGLRAWPVSEWTPLGRAGDGRGWARLSAPRPLRLKAGEATDVEFVVKLPAPDVPSRGRLRMHALWASDRPTVRSAWTAVDRDRMERWLSLLPSVYRAAAATVPDGPLPVQLKCMDAMLAPCEREIDGFPEMLDPMRTREDFLPLLGHWLAAGTRTGDALPPNREWIARAVELAQRRGTLGGLVEMLEAATGLGGFSVDEQHERFHISVQGPREAAALQGALRRLIDQQRPAHITYDLTFAAPVDR